MIKENDMAWAKEQLQLKKEELGRTPKKEDFDEVTRCRIKAFLGPWPRALEAAGLKEPRVAKRINECSSLKKKRKKRSKKLNDKKEGNN